MGTTMSMELDYGSTYMNSFMGFKRGQSTISLGYVYYKINQIEEYDSDANYLGEFMYLNNAIMLGYAKRVSNLVLGVGANVIYENFSGLGSWAKPNIFYGFDFGFTFLDLKFGKNFQMTTGGVMKSVFNDSLKIEQSANSYSALFAKLSTIAYAFNKNNKIYVNYFGDIVFLKALGRYNLNLGMQTDFAIRKSNLRFNIGAANITIPINDYSESDTDYLQTSYYNRKISLGIGVDLPIRNSNFSFDYSFIFNNVYFDGWYLSFKFER